MSIPPIIIGTLVRSTDWGETNFFETGKYCQKIIFKKVKNFGNQNQV